MRNHSFFVGKRTTPPRAKFHRCLVIATRPDAGQMTTQVRAQRRKPKVRACVHKFKFSNEERECMAFLKSQVGRADGIAGVGFDWRSIAKRVMTRMNRQEGRIHFSDVQGIAAETFCQEMQVMTVLGLMSAEPVRFLNIQFRREIDSEMRVLAQSVFAEVLIAQKNGEPQADTDLQEIEVSWIRTPQPDDEQHSTD